MMGVCGLCRETRELQNSHFLPSAGYKHIQDSTTGAKGTPVLIMPKKTQLTSIQAKAPFLCWDCEQRFCQRGEDPILRQCAHQDGQFSLREQLQATAPLCSDH